MCCTHTQKEERRGERERDGEDSIYWVTARNSAITGAKYNLSKEFRSPRHISRKLVQKWDSKDSDQL